MGRGAPWRALRWSRSRVFEAATIAAVVVAASLALLTAGAPSHLVSSRAGASGVRPTGVDPQFLPTLVTPSILTPNGSFGKSVALTSNYLVVGQPNGSEYGYLHVGGVLVENRTTGANYTLHPPELIESTSYGATVAASGNLLVVGAPDTYHNQSEAGAVYLYSLSNGTLLKTYYLPFTSGSIDWDDDSHFGAAVAISGNTIVVGAPDMNYSGQSYPSGAALLIDAVNGAETFLSPPLGAADQTFGASVAISASEVAIGDPNISTVFTFSSVTGDLVNEYNNPVPQANSYFGASVAISGPMLAVGAPGEMPSLEPKGAGEVDLIDMPGNLTSQIVSPDPETGASFGFSLATDGSALVVGTNQSHASKVGTVAPFVAGAAYVFSLTDGTFLSSVLTPTWPITNGTGEFGYAVAVSGSTVLVGRPGANYSLGPGNLAGAGQNAGLAYLFGEVPLTVGTMDTALPEASQLGTSVALSDGIAVFGAPNETGAANGVIRSGNVYVVSTASLSAKILSSPHPGQFGEFGFSVGISGSTTVVGAPGENSTGTGGVNVPEGGRAYEYNTSTGALQHQLLSGAPDRSGSFGASVAVDAAWVVVGSPGQNLSGLDGSGEVFVYFATNGTLALSIPNPEPVLNASFGASVSVSGNTVVVGVPGVDNASYAAPGRVYLYTLTSGGKLSTNLTLTNPDPQNQDRFGWSVAVSGSLVLVGAPGFNDAGIAGSGRAYTFTTAGALTGTLASLDPQLNGSFGFAVAYDGGSMAVGAPHERGDPVAPIVMSGNVYLFAPGNSAPLDRYGSPNAQEYGAFGSSVAIGPSRVVVGAEDESDFQDAHGGLGYILCM